MFSIDITSRTPICQQLEKNIIQQISLGILKAHDQLPSLRGLAQELHINPNTVQKVYSALEQKGVIYTLSGRGAFVSDNNSSVISIQLMTKEKLKSVSREAKEMGISLEDQIKIIKMNFEDDKHD